MERKWVVVAFGDIMGFGTWSRRAVNTPEIRNPFIQNFYNEMQAFAREEGSYMKYLGDGFMILKELPEKGRVRAMMRQFLKDVKTLTKQMRELVAACDWPPPDGFRTRIVAGHVDRILVEDPQDKKRKVPEYVGYTVNLAQRLLEVSPKAPLICHESVLSILGARKGSLRFRKLRETPERPRGVDTEDVAGLWIVEL